MSCKNNSCKVCTKLVFINEAAFTAGSVVLTLPENFTYADGCKYCFVLTTNLPDTVTLNAPVVAVVGTGTTQFPVLTCCGRPMLSQQLATRRRYPFRVNTTATGGTITILSCLPMTERNNLNALNDAT